VVCFRQSKYNNVNNALCRITGAGMVESLIWVGRLGIPFRFSIVVRDFLLFRHPDLLWGPGSPLFDEYQLIFQRREKRSRRETWYFPLHLVPGLRIFLHGVYRDNFTFASSSCRNELCIRHMMPASVNASRYRRVHCVWISAEFHKVPYRKKQWNCTVILCAFYYKYFLRFSVVRYHDE